MDEFSGGEGVNGRLEPFRKFICFGTLNRPLDCYDFQGGWGDSEVPSSKCVLIVIVIVILNIIVEKAYTLNPEILHQFSAQKALFKVPKICHINFWIENDPPPLELSQKFIRFGTFTRPFGS